MGRRVRAARRSEGPHAVEWRALHPLRLGTARAGRTQGPFAFPSGKVTFSRVKVRGPCASHSLRVQGGTAACACRGHPSAGSSWCPSWRGPSDWSLFSALPAGPCPWPATASRFRAAPHGPAAPGARIRGTPPPRPPPSVRPPSRPATRRPRPSAIRTERELRTGGPQHVALGPPPQPSSPRSSPPSSRPPRPIEGVVPDRGRASHLPSGQLNGFRPSKGWSVLRHPTH